MITTFNTKPALLCRHPQVDSRQILVADAGNGLREYLSDILSKMGYKPVCAAGWIEALKLFTNSSFDFVFTDSKMICWDGFSVAYHIKTRSPATPVVMMVNKSSENSPDNLEGCCFDVLLFKPFETMDIQTVFRTKRLKMDWQKMTAIEKTNTEKRSCERYAHEVLIHFTRFNTGCWLKAQTLNHCLEGMCVKTNVHFQPGTTLLIRVEHDASRTSGTCAFEVLPTLILAEVKWCREIPDESFSSYEAGVKYYAPHY